MIDISIVSHGHGSMIYGLVTQLLSFNEVTRIIITNNIYESIKLPKSSRLTVIQNGFPLGFGKNHNKAFFEYSRSPYYCVLNPDIKFKENPFGLLLSHMELHCAVLSAPKVVNVLGIVEDSARPFPNVLNLSNKIFFGEKLFFEATNFEKISFPDWVAGMFMLFEESSFKTVSGFDESFYLYYEDVDICKRIQKINKKIILCNEVEVIHDARRASRRNLRHFVWHATSMLRYLLKIY